MVAHNRGLYRLLDAHTGGVSEADKARVRQNLATDLARAEDAFATCRATPLAVDERAAGDHRDRNAGCVGNIGKVIPSFICNTLPSSVLK